MSTYIHQRKYWPQFSWDEAELSTVLGEVRYIQGKINGRMEAFGFTSKSETILKTLTEDVLKSSEIEGEVLGREEVRSSIARRLGIEIAGLVPSDRNVDGVVEMTLDATQNYKSELTKERLLGWQSSLFPSGRSGMYKILTGKWRDNEKGPMQVVSGPMGRETVHFEAPDATRLEEEMAQFLAWFNSSVNMDPVIKSGIAHLWFVTIHPFDDGNGRIARAIADMQLARTEGSGERYYSMSSQIRKRRSEYYAILEKTQKGNLDITSWLQWFLLCMRDALQATEETLNVVLQRVAFWDKYADVPLNERQRLMIQKMQEDFFGKLTSSKWAKIMKCSQDTAGRDISDLIAKGLLTKDRGGGRSSAYLLVW
ncbi:Fic family protein [Dyadobacter sp. CY356]|uniref:Fic family protein n=1 Tax=Dyadobacter sp. CY356 TaxID=2906442 RepID=UPI001F4357BB|nr:Fic family protein [Dyadobacter sp. CY356]MCF0057997.1 Fic family protein [Dyadobacter sp. CY356]